MANPSYSTAIHYKAPAKVNLYLGVHRGRDERGYHPVDSIMAAIDYCDIVSVAPAPKLTLACEPSVGCIDVSNTCWRAAIALAKLFDFAPNYAITVQKHIPFQAGLGGSSSDAAATILALCDFEHIDKTDPRVMQAARSVGADVPFFLHGEPSYWDGAGNRFSESFAQTLASLEHAPIVLIKPACVGVSTPAAYAAFDEKPTAAAAFAEALEAFRSGDLRRAVKQFSNNLGEVACRLSPEIQQSLSWLRGQQGVLASLVTGSGSSSFALCDSHEAARDIALRAHECSLHSHATKFIMHGPQRISQTKAHTKGHYLVG